MKNPPIPARPASSEKLIEKLVRENASRIKDGKGWPGWPSHPWCTPVWSTDEQ